MFEDERVSVFEKERERERDIYILTSLITRDDGEEDHHF